MNSLKFGVAVAIAAAAIPGTAEAAQIVTTGTNATTVQVANLDAGTNNSFTIGFSDANLANPFNELLTFTTDVAGMLNILVGTVGASAENNVTFNNVFLTGTGLPNPNGVPLSQVLFDPNDTFVRNMISVGPGTYTLNIQGTPGTQNGSLSGNVAFNAIAAVPEPGTWAMMLLGFGAIGFSMRRTRRHAAHLYQAA
ncbi:FxDxF family PEP-CTERM protein [Sphingomonas glaciei]|uniref:FxDxF family PEP-CTERM protein n=1 Tax=Sphingomonas glaciei TaxID=2938948 RepID=A0ABY5MS39_9SPHN|nr:FxDxF family PEP-CTERM protein [Sphingomonas glaciei]UUR06953.1 FxDxF family PEP-CTERM protein [Sphingomonas glaciei]